jgi:hypothetical protein
MRLLDEKKPLRDIRAFVDEKYGRRGPPTPTPAVP